MHEGIPRPLNTRSATVRERTEPAPSSASVATAVHIFGGSLFAASGDPAPVGVFARACTGKDSFFLSCVHYTCDIRDRREHVRRGPKLRCLVSSVEATRAPRNPESETRSPHRPTGGFVATLLLRLRVTSSCLHPCTSTPLLSVSRTAQHVEYGREAGDQAQPDLPPRGRRQAQQAQGLLGHPQQQDLRRECRVWPLVSPDELLADAQPSPPPLGDRPTARRCLSFSTTTRAAMT